MWRFARIFCASVVGLLFVWGFINLHNAAPADWEHFVERIQLVPALLGSVSGVAWALVILALLLALTLVFGRVYCSFLCPLGIAQDIVIRLRRITDRLRGKKPTGPGRRYAPPVPYVRYVVLTLVIVSSLFLGAVVLAWLDPYSIAGRFLSGIVNPLAAELTNAAVGEQVTAPAWERYGWLLLLVGGMFLLPLILAWWRGRLYCNTLCPVGALLGILSRRPLMRIGMDPNGCVRCAACVRACKAQCIDLKTYRVDTSRCINCYDCISACEHGLRPHLVNPFRSPGSEFSPAPPKRDTREKMPADNSRRAFMGLLAAGLPVVAASPAIAAGSEEGEGNTALATSPPGSVGVSRFLSHCTGCGLCITACPTHVLQPSTLQYGFSGFLKPYLDFTKGFCNFDCTACSSVCPVGAILPLSRPEKQRTQIALASFHSERCIVHCHQTECGACTEHCPTKALSTFEGKVPSCKADVCIACNACVEVCPQHAISLVSDGEGGMHATIDRAKCIACGKCARVCPSGAMTSKRLLVPILDEKLCIGCGACSYACPVRPERAMQITPRSRHLTAEVLREKPAENPVSTDDFPF